MKKQYRAAPLLIKHNSDSVDDSDMGSSVLLKPLLNKCDSWYRTSALGEVLTACFPPSSDSGDKISTYLAGLLIT